MPLPRAVPVAPTAAERTTLRNRARGAKTAYRDRLRACQLPAATGVPLSRWTGPELLAEVTRAGTDCELSASSVRRILAEHPVKPWQYQSWIAPRDPPAGPLSYPAAKIAAVAVLRGAYRGRQQTP
jgi:hypothetical protein